MTQGVKNLIDAIASGDSLAIDAAFNSEMANRISERLDDMRTDVAQNMFRTESVAGPDDESEEEVEEQEPFEEEISPREAKSRALGQKVSDHHDAAKKAEKGSAEYHQHMQLYHNAAIDHIEHSEKTLGKAASPYNIGGGGQPMRNKDQHAAEAKKHAALAN